MFKSDLGYVYMGIRDLLVSNSQSLRNCSKDISNLVFLRYNVYMGRYNIIHYSSPSSTSLFLEYKHHIYLYLLLLHPRMHLYLSILYISINYVI